MSDKMKNRNNVVCPIFGIGADLRPNVLPTYNDCMKKYLLLKSSAGRNIDVLNMLVSDIMAIWNKVSVPILSQQRIKVNVRNYLKRYQSKLKKYQELKGNREYRTKLKTFLNESFSLFDISACKCDLRSDCGCSVARSISNSEKEFLADQRTERKMVLRESELNLSKKMDLENQSQSTKTVFKNENSFEGSVVMRPKNKLQQLKEKKECSEVCQSLVNISSTKRNTLKLENTATICDRFRIKNGAASSLATAVLQDIELITPNNMNLVIDRKKIWRARQKNRKRLSDTKIGNIKALFFDGRKDKTLKITKRNGIRYRRTVTEEHITLLEEPESQYIGHTVPKSGKAIHIKDSICEFFQSYSINDSDFAAVGCDGTNTNVGNKNGVITRLEKTLKRPLQRLICQLHANELNLRHLLTKLDGVTSGPTTFSGPIGSQLKTSHLKPIVEFEPIPTTIPILTTKVSSDQQYLYDICNAVSSGYCSQSLANRHTGIFS